MERTWKQGWNLVSYMYLKSLNHITVFENMDFLSGDPTQKDISKSTSTFLQRMPAKEGMEDKMQQGCLMNSPLSQDKMDVYCTTHGNVNGSRSSKHTGC